MSKIYVVGIGPGGIDEMTPRARKALEASEAVVGYGTYIDLIKSHLPNLEYLVSGMTREVERCEMAIARAKEGAVVSVVSSGDSGVYGMAGLVLELMIQQDCHLPVEIIPGITSAIGGAAVLGAPLTHDFAIISLSDLLTPWEVIEKRLDCAAAGDFVICLYNPKSHKRVTHIERAREIIGRYRKDETPVGIVRNAGREGENKVITSLGEMLNQEIDMFSMVIIGNSQTYVSDNWMITPRGYDV